MKPKQIISLCITVGGLITGGALIGCAYAQEKATQKELNEITNKMESNRKQMEFVGKAFNTSGKTL